MNDNSGWMYVTMLAAGLAIPAMAATSAEIGQRVGPPTAALAIFTAAAFTSAIFAQLNGGLHIEELGNVAKPALLGGGIISFYLLSVSILGPKIGMGTAILLVLGGQIASAAIIDTFGLLGAPRVPINGMRSLGIALVVIGVMLARRPVP